MDSLHERKIEGFTAIGYEVIADDGLTTTLAYVPHSREYIKLAEIEAGKTKGSVVLSIKELSNLSSRLGRPKNRKRKV
ncbi:hypothetical protein D3C75_426310 [compost metagenome]